ncbi:TPA: hypothetical protein ACHTPE_003546 [Escherichia coli]
MTTMNREEQKQVLIDTANHIINRDNTSPYSENLRELARIALASMEAEPVAEIQISRGGYDKGEKIIDYYSEEIQHLTEGHKLYAAPLCFRVKPSNHKTHSKIFPEIFQAGLSAASGCLMMSGTSLFFATERLC